MANPSVTYTFAGGYAISSGEMNTNFADLIAALTDGTKDISVAAVTANGTLTGNGNTVLGNSISNTLTIKAQIRSGLAICNNSYYTVLNVPASQTSNYALNLPSTAPTSAGYVPVFTNDQAVWQDVQEPASMSDIKATKMGFYNYSADIASGTNDTAYYGGNKGTISLMNYSGAVSVAVSSCFGEFLTYKTSGGKWRLKFNLMVNPSVNTMYTGLISINGVTFKNITNYNQALSRYAPQVGTWDGIGGTAYAIPNTSRIYIENQGSSSYEQKLFVGGEVSLETMPAWAWR
jgi:hypothetical protein